MPGSYHIINDRYPASMKHMPHEREAKRVVSAVCEEPVDLSRHNSCCNIKVANPDLSYDWCHDCVRSIIWPDDMKAKWTEKHGIKWLGE